MVCVQWLSCPSHVHEVSVLCICKIGQNDRFSGHKSLNLIHWHHNPFTEKNTPTNIVGPMSNQKLNNHRKKKRQHLTDRLRAHQERNRCTVTFQLATTCIHKMQQKMKEKKTNIHNRKTDRLNDAIAHRHTKRRAKHIYSP